MTLDGATGWLLICESTLSHWSPLFGGGNVATFATFSHKLAIVGWNIICYFQMNVVYVYKENDSVDDLLVRGAGVCARPI